MRRSNAIDTRSMRAEQERLVRVRTELLAHQVLALGSIDPATSERTEELVVELACAAEAANPSITLHLERIGRYAALLARSLGWPLDRSDLLRMASMLHDLGKVGIPDSVLLNEGVFTRDDRLLMERHAELGHELLRSTGSKLLDLGAVIALSHHERFDGTGYPNGLRARGIPIEGRIAAIADVFDALTTERRYKPAMNLVQARALMMVNRDTHFDAALLDLFFDQPDELTAIRRRWAEPRHRGRGHASPGGG